MRGARLASGMTQVAVAVAMTDNKVSTVQSQVSDWENGNLQPSFEQLAHFEDAIGLPRGSILAEVGYVHATEVELAIYADGTLTKKFKQELLDAYHSVRRLSRSDRSRSAAGRQGSAG